MTFRNRALSQLETMQNRLAILTEAIHSLPELPENAKLWATDTELRIHIPYDWQTFKVLRRCLGSRWKYQSQFDGNEGDMYRRYSNGKVKLIITLNVDYEDSTCHREIIGTKEKPIYKVICNG